MANKYIDKTTKKHFLDKKLLDLATDVLDLGRKLRSLVGEDTATDDRTGHTASSAKRNLGGNEHIGNVLILAKKRKVKKDLQRLSISSHDDQVRDTTVKSLGGLVGTLLQLFVVGSLLNEVQNGNSQLRVCQGVCFRINLGHDFENASLLV